MLNKTEEVQLSGIGYNNLSEFMKIHKVFFFYWWPKNLFIWEADSFQQNYLIKVKNVCD